MIWRNSPVVRAGHHQDGRIFRPIHNVMVWRIRVKRLELFWVFYSAKFSYVERAVWRELHAQHVVNSYLRHDSLHQIGVLGNDCAHQEAAIASSLDRKFLRARVVFFDQIFRRSSEIIEHVLLFREIAGLVPVFAELAAATNIRHDVDAAAIEPKPPRKLKIWRQADPVAAVSVKERWVLAIALHSFAENDVEGNFGSIF